MQAIRMTGACVLLLVLAAAVAPLAAAGSGDSVCSLEKTVGPCRGSFGRFFFNEQSGQCEAFTYGGCHGNGNNFRTLDACSQTCGVAAKSADCAAGPEVGPCRGHFVRFFHNSESGQCEEFVYGGCHGNGNNFKSQQECQDVCTAAAATALPVPIADRTRVKPAVVVTAAAAAAGAKVNAACSQAKKVGPCRASMPRFFFNQETGSCDLFQYGGCHGNANNFRSEAECEATCAPTANAPQDQGRTIEAEAEAGEVKEETDVCNQEVDSGPCYGAFPRYFHNKRSGQCEVFEYGGCHGNGNNFRSEVECETVCGNAIAQVILDEVMPEQKADDGEKEEEEGEEQGFKDPKVICALPAEDGGCRAAFPMYYFNKESGSCEEFIYGGCRGNGNRFPSLQACSQFCAPLM